MEAVAEWERFKEILEEEVSKCVPLKKRSYEVDQEEEESLEVLHYRS